MLSNLVQAAFVRRAGLIMSCVALVVITQFSGAGKAPIRNLSLDPTASKVELFDGMETGSLSARMIANDITGGNVFIENKTNKPLTIIMPEAFVGVHVFKQMGGMMGGMGGMGGGMMGGMGGMGGMMGRGGMGGQSMGGGMGRGMMGGMGGGMGGMGGMGGGMGGGFFSIPPFKVAQVPFQSVCLNYGKPDPIPLMTYRLTPLEDYTDDKVLQSFLRIFGTSQIDYSIAQAAAWHLTDKLTGQDLAGLSKLRIPGDDSSKIPVFSAAQLSAADMLVSVSKKQAVELEKLEANKPAPVKKRTLAPVTRANSSEAKVTQRKPGR
jgi:hypothetical protein